MRNDSNFDQEFFDALGGEDDLGAVIRTHLFIENQLDRFLNLLCDDFKFLDKDHLEYGTRVNLAVALGLKEEHASALKAIGTLRNQFAHNLKAELNESAVNNLYNALSSGDQTCVQEAYESTKKKVPEAKVEEKIKHLSPKDRFVLIAIAIKSLLQAGINEKEKDLKNGNFSYQCKCGRLNGVCLNDSAIGETPDHIAWSCPSCNQEYDMKVCWRMLD